MKKAWPLIALLSFSSGVLAADGDQPRVEVRKVEAQGAGGLLDQMWATLRRYAPRLTASNDSEHRVTLVAGVRGAESTTSALTPYWKGDKSTDAVYQAEVASYNRAQALADKGDFGAAASEFDAFVRAHVASPLRANAEFALGLSYVGAGDRVKGAAGLRTFIKDFPQHPLRPEAEHMLNELART